MKKTSLLLSFVLPLPAFAASFYPIKQAGPHMHVIEAFPDLGIVLVEEEGGFPNQLHTVYDEPFFPSNNWTGTTNYSQPYATNSDWYPPNAWDYPQYDGDNYGPTCEWCWPPPWDWDYWYPPAPWPPYPWPPAPEPEPEPIPPPVTGVTWGLDRINQRNLPLDGTYGLKGSASVTAFILDTGVQPHSELGQNLQEGFDASYTGGTTDCMGHGTHVAGTVAATNYGVAPGTQVVPVKVFSGCSGSTTTQIILRGLNYVAGSTARPAVVNMSLGGGADQALDDAVTAVINKGVHVVVAAGNDSTDACTGSPGRLGQYPGVITVGATSRDDSISYFSNIGSCVNIYAPGHDIESLTPQSGITTMSGTSMASPHVAGAIALYLATHPTATPDEGKQYLNSVATPNVITQNGYLTSDKLLYVGAE